MPRDERWPIGWTVSLMSIHLVVAIALLGIAASDLGGYGYTIWSLWIVPQCCVVILATLIHIILVCFAKLNPAWALSFYLILWSAWVALASVAGIFWSTTYYRYSDGGSYDYYGYYDYYYDYYSILGFPKVIAELSLISVCGLSNLAIWIFCCVIVNRWRMQRKILLLRASQMPQQPIIQYVQYTGPMPPGQFPGQPIDPKNGPYTTYYTIPTSGPDGVQYPQPTQPPFQHHSMTSSHADMAQYSHPSQSPPQQYGQYPPPAQTPVQLPTNYRESTQSPPRPYSQYPPPAQTPVQLPANYRESSQSPANSGVQHPVPVQSPVPIQIPVGIVGSDPYPTYNNT